MVKGYQQYLKENCGCGENLPATVDPIEVFSKVATTIASKPDTCPNCSKFPEECECKGTCRNCGVTNGQCDCSLNQDISIGDIVRNVSSSCPHYNSIGRVIDMPSNNSVTFVHPNYKNKKFMNICTNNIETLKPDNSDVIIGTIATSHSKKLSTMGYATNDINMEPTTVSNEIDEYILTKDITQDP